MTLEELKQEMLEELHQKHAERKQAEPSHFELRSHANQEVLKESADANRLVKKESR